jgi:hypothetical protein
VRFDKLGFPVTASSSGKHCEGCGIVFALGHLPVDGSLICRECRNEPAPAPEPNLFDPPSEAPP